MNVNLVIIYGNLTRDPELRQTQSGLAVVSLGVATNRVFKNQQGEKDTEVEYHNVTLFGKMAETANQYLKKGSGAFITGRLKTSSWESDGVKKYKTEIIAEKLQFGPRRAGDSDNKDQSSFNQGSNQSSSDVDIDLEDIPF